MGKKRQSAMAVYEITELRERFGGGDGKAINKHSRRVYYVPSYGWCMLDRTLDANPPFFQLYELRGDPRTCRSRPYLPSNVRVEGQEGFGDGLSWPKAEKMALAVLLEYDDAWW